MGGDEYHGGFFQMDSFSNVMWCFAGRVLHRSFNRIVDRIKSHGMVMSSTGGFAKRIRSVMLCGASQGAFYEEVLIAWLKGSRTFGWR